MEVVTPTPMGSFAEFSEIMKALVALEKFDVFRIHLAVLTSAYTANSISSKKVNAWGDRGVVAAFRRKIQLYQEKFQDGDTTIFPQMMTLSWILCPMLNTISARYQMCIKQSKVTFPGWTIAFVVCKFDRAFSV